MKMWDGRFSKTSDSLMEQFNNSLPVDRELVEEDIAGSVAWARALRRGGTISRDDCDRIVAGLEKLLEKHRTKGLDFQQSDEDIHMALERLLVKEIGEAGARLHTGRSRNDQVATDLRLYAKRVLGEISELVRGLQQVLLARAEEDVAVVVPGYTHLQQAQPISMAQYWLSFVFALERERTRCRCAVDTADRMPLGSGALAGTGFPLDRDALAGDLGFSTVSENSLDGVASRDFVLEGLAVLASLGILVSRYAEDLIIWSSREFGFVTLDDAWSTGSSMMPQKKNPDSLELVRGKCGRFVGNYTRFATTLKGVGLAYYKDLQEDKEPFFDSAAQMTLVLRVLALVIKTLTVNAETIAERLDPFLFATDVADYLVRKGLPFREAHKVVGKLVGSCIEKDTEIASLTVDRLREFSELFDSDIADVFSWDTALAHRDVQGGTGPESIKRQIAEARELLSS